LLDCAVPSAALTYTTVRTTIKHGVGLAGLALALATVLAAHAFRGWFARYTADHCCAAGIERVAGFWVRRLTGTN
jgi:hypothetical protein